MRLLDSIPDSMDVNLSKLRDIVEDRGDPCASVHGSQRVERDLVMEQQPCCFFFLFQLFTAKMIL